MGKLFVVGIGPGSYESGQMTIRAHRALKASDVIIGYSAYLDLIRAGFEDKELVSSLMRQEIERCRLALERASGGETVSLICSGDAGIYGMASPVCELSQEYPDVAVEMISGVTAASGGAALLGAPLGHDFCVISLSDLLTPWEMIEKRLTAAAMSDLAIAIYNPSSHKRSGHLRRACEVLLKVLPETTPCGIAENIGREGETARVCTLRELCGIKVNMFSTVFVGNSMTRIIEGRLVTPRGYIYGKDNTP